MWQRPVPPPWPEVLLLLADVAGEAEGETPVAEVAAGVVAVAPGAGDAVVSFPAEQPASNAAGRTSNGRNRFMPH